MAFFLANHVEECVGELFEVYYEMVLLTWHLALCNAVIMDVQNVSMPDPDSTPFVMASLKGLLEAAIVVAAAPMPPTLGLTAPVATAVVMVAPLTCVRVSFYTSARPEPPLPPARRLAGDMREKSEAFSEAWFLITPNCNTFSLASRPRTFAMPDCSI